MPELRDHKPDDDAKPAPVRANQKPSLAFRDLIQKDPVVCNNCFQVTHDAVAFDRYSGVYGWHTIEYWYGRRNRTVPAHHERMTYGMTSACNCGEITSGKRRPLTYQAACEYAENLLDTLREKQIGVNEHEFRAKVRELKRDSANQGREDTDVFAPAVEHGIRTATTTRTYDD